MLVILSVLNQTPCCRLLVWSYFLIEQLSADIIHIELCLVLLRFRNCRWWSATLGFKGKTLVFDSFSAVRITPCKLYMYTTVVWFNILIQTHTHTHPFNGPFSGTTQVSRYQKGNTNLGFCEARDSEWQWHQLGHMQVCTLLQTDNHASTPPVSFLQAGCPSCCPTNSVRALKALTYWYKIKLNIFVNCPQAIMLVSVDKIVDIASPEKSKWHIAVNGNICWTGYILF